MIHGPCGLLKSSDPCMRSGGSCSKQFPKRFSDITTSTKYGYQLYRRRENLRYLVVAGAKQDNRWVVPYNPCLCLKFNAHINVEICSPVGAVKYLYKYVYVAGEMRFQAKRVSPRRSVFLHNHGWFKYS